MIEIYHVRGFSADLSLELNNNENIILFKIHFFPTIVIPRNSKSWLAIFLLKEYGS